MNYDYCSHLAGEQDSIVKKILHVENEIKSERNKKNKEQKEIEVENLRKQLSSQSPHLFYHVLAVKPDSSEDAFRSTWQKANIQRELDDSLIHVPSIDMSLLPDFSFLIQFKFTLEKPYISRDEQEFYIIDNPIRKDKIFGLPYVAPTSWKGSLRAALWQNGYKSDNEQICRIFGNERREEEHTKLKAGRLHLFPTFFDKIGLEIINPHDRGRRVGKNPILMECVPTGTSGLFTVLYVPYNLVGKDSETIKKQVPGDIKLLATGLSAMFRGTGFGAKTSSGYGLAENAVEDGCVIFRAKGIEVSPKGGQSIEPPEERFMKYLNVDGIIKDEFKGSGDADLLSNKEYGERGKQSGGGNLSEFKEFRKWLGQYGEKWQRELRLKNTHTDWPTWNFESFDDLLIVVKGIEKSLMSEEGPQ